MTKNIFHKLAVATVGSALSCAVLMQANQAKAASFSFTQGGYGIGFSGEAGFVPTPEPGIPPIGPNNVISGTFTGEDVNGNGVISGSEVTAFTLDFFGLELNNASLSFNLSTKDLVLTAISSFPSPLPSIFSVVAVNSNPGGGDLFRYYYLRNDVPGRYVGVFTGFSSQRAEVTEIAPPKSVPEPRENAMTLLAVLGVGFLLKKKVSSKNQQFKPSLLQLTK